LFLSRNKVWILLTGFSLLLVICGYHLADRYGLLIGFFAAVGLNALIFLYNDWRLAARFPGRDLEGQDPWGLLRLAHDVAKKNALPCPNLREIQCRTPFLFSNGMLSKNLRIYYSTALVQRFSKDEIQRLFELEMIRFRSGQTRMRTTAVALADSWLFLMGCIDSVFLFKFFSRGQARQWCRGPLTALSLPVLSIILRLVTSRNSVSSLDQQAVDEFGDAQAFARTLEKLDSYSKTLPMDVNFAEATLFTVDPLAHHRWSVWTSVQPPIDRRLRKITGQYPL
jgi:heat shock protein HtpX